MDMAKKKYIATPEVKYREGRDCYVYVHERLDTKEVFYVGIGSKKRFKRAFDKNGRNVFWKDIVNKYPCVSKVIYTELTWEEACEIEINLISHFGRSDKKLGTLCNLTDGGEGGKGVIFTQERRDKISKALTGKPTSEEHKRKCRERRHTPETIEKIRRLKTGIKASQETRIKMQTTNMKGINAAAKKISKLVLNTQTGIYYDSIKEASLSLGLSRSYVAAMLRGLYKNRTDLIYV